MPYDEQTTYNKFGTGCSDNEDSSSDGCGCATSDDCSCCPVGTVGVYNDEGEHIGCLSPNDAEIYNNSLIEPDNGYVKVIHPTTGKYLGNLPVSEAIDYLDYLTNGTVTNAAQNVFNLLTPEVGPSGFYELTYPFADGITVDVPFTFDRVGVTESIMMNIINATADIQFDPSGLTRVVGTSESDLTTKFVWTGVVAASIHTFTVRITTSTQILEVPIRLTLT